VTQIDSADCACEEAVELLKQKQSEAVDYVESVEEQPVSDDLKQALRPRYPITYHQ
jgi:hypothetical protein